MMHSITINQQNYPIIATRRKGARRFVLRFNVKKQAITLSLPIRANLKDAMVFVQAHKSWIQQQIEKSRRQIALKPGMVISVLGVPLLLQHEEGRGLATYDPTSNDSPVSSSLRIVENHEAILTIHGDITFFERRLRDWLTNHLRAHITQLAEEKARELRVKFARIQIRDTSSHWGSCSASGTLSFTFKLVFASAAQLEYVVCHEVAHLREMNHSPKFWKLVEQLCPDYAKHRRWLKTHGHELGTMSLQ